MTLKHLLAAAILAIPAPLLAQAPDFGDDSSLWANDGECDDPRFEGTGMANPPLMDMDILADASDCSAAWAAGTIGLAQANAPAQPAPSQPATTASNVIDGIDFGDDSSAWAFDGECDDPRFDGPGTAALLLDNDILADATDCIDGYLAGTVFLADGGASTTTITSLNIDGIDFGDDSSTWAMDGECDDPRFEGPGTAAILLDTDRFADATDCSDAYLAGTVTFIGDGDMGGTDLGSVIDGIDFGDDSSAWAFDGECDDPRFEGPGTASFLVEADRFADATDCMDAYLAGTISLAGETGTGSMIVDGIDFGADSGAWVFDGECDDPRFEGPGTALVLLDSDRFADATDCRDAYLAGTVMFIGDGGMDGGDMIDGIDFGADSSAWVFDGECDDPRFEGPGTATVLLEEDIGGDASDCRDAYLAGTVVLAPGHSGSLMGGTVSASGIDFGDDSGNWPFDSECDDPRFTGEAMAFAPLMEDRGRDATDCQVAFDSGLIQLLPGESGALGSSDVNVVLDGIEFGDDSSIYSLDAECDDPRFEGPGVAFSLNAENLGADATDCREGYLAGSVALRMGQTGLLEGALTQTITFDGIEFGDDTSTWAFDVECDDPRFTGAGMAQVPVAADRGHDASDCLAAYQNGTVALAPGQSPTLDGTVAVQDAGKINFGDDNGMWPFDGECDDPRFAGPGMTQAATDDANIGGDATDCRTAWEQGRLWLPGAEPPDTIRYGIIFGNDSGAYPFDGECDDRRFFGTATAASPNWESLGRDATDCLAAFENGSVQLWDREEAYAATNCAVINFGDDSGPYPGDSECDDMRFEGPGVSSWLDPSNQFVDATDCRRLCELGVIALRDY